MAQDRFLIAPIKEGLRTDLESWMLPEDAFAKLENAYMHEGLIRKRVGSTYTGDGWTTAVTQPLFSRLRIALPGGAGIGRTKPAGAGAGDATGTVPGAVFEIGQMFSIGTEIFTVYQNGVMFTTGATPTHTYYLTGTPGVYNFVGATADTQIYFYPAQPVMGLTNFETNILNDNPAVAFDTQFVYQYDGSSWIMVGPTVGSEFKGQNYDFFQATNWRGIRSDVGLMFVTNFNAAIPAAATDDPMWYYAGSGLAGWTAFQPVFIVGANFVRSARIILPFKDRLILLNTVENDGSGGLGVNTAHVNRCRFSHNGSPVAASAYYEPNQVGSTGGGWIDAATKEQIIGAEFIKDRLIVYFEKSTWELAYTGNAVQPFLWQKINTELGSESTFSSVPFDKAVLTVGTTGIHACSGANVVRIDQTIPKQIFKIRNDNEGPLRVAGIRDYFLETVYWAFPSANSDNFAKTYPGKILVYDYKFKTWAINDDSITAFGYYEQQTGRTWASTDLTWAEADFAWGSGTIQPQFRQIIAGNQQGFVFKVESTIASNESVLQITNMSTGAGYLATIDVIEHNLATDDYIKISNCQGVTGVNGNIYKVTSLALGQIQILTTRLSPFAGTYTGGGTIARVSQIDILTKRYNPYIKTGKNVSIDSVDFAVQKTDEGKITVDYHPSSSNVSMVQDGIVSGAIMGTNVLETSAYALVPLEASQDLLWHRVYFGAEGDSIQLRLYLNEAQMTDPEISESRFTLEGFILNMSTTGRVA